MKVERLAILLMCVVSLSSCSEPPRPVDKTIYWNPATKVVIVQKTLEAGQTITAAQLKEEDVPSGCCPLDALTKDECLGKTLERGIDEGSVLTLACVKVSAAESARLRHWEPVPADYKGSQAVVIFTTKDLPGGSEFSSDVLEEKQVAEKCVPVGSVVSTGAVVGAYATVDLPAGVPIVNADVTNDWQH